MANYIHTLQAEVKRLKDIINYNNETVNNLRRYLHSSKFHCGDELDGYVNVNDVFEHLKDLKGV